MEMLFLLGEIILSVLAIIFRIVSTFLNAFIISTQTLTLFLREFPLSWEILFSLFLILKFLMF